VIGLAVGLMVSGFLLWIMRHELRDPCWYQDSISMSIIAGVYGAVLTIGASLAGLIEIIRIIIRH